MAGRAPETIVVAGEVVEDRASGTSRRCPSKPAAQGAGPMTGNARGACRAAAPNSGSPSVAVARQTREWRISASRLAHAADFLASVSQKRGFMLEGPKLCNRNRRPKEGRSRRTNAMAFGVALQDLEIGIRMGPPSEGKGRPSRGPAAQPPGKVPHGVGGLGTPLDLAHTRPPPRLSAAESIEGRRTVTVLASFAPFAGALVGGRRGSNPPLPLWR